MTLDWVFADEKRVAFGYTITGLPDIPKVVNLSGNISVKDQQCKLVGGAGGGSSSVQWVEGNPGTVTGSWGTFTREPLSQPAIIPRCDSHTYFLALWLKYNAVSYTHL